MYQTIQILHEVHDKDNIYDLKSLSLFFSPNSMIGSSWKKKSETITPIYKVRQDNVILSETKL